MTRAHRAATAIVTAAALIPAVMAGSAQAKVHYTYGPRGSCHAFVWYDVPAWQPGYKEYANGRYDGRCVLQ